MLDLGHLFKEKEVSATGAYKPVEKDIGAAVFRMELPLPPSANRLYSHRGPGGRWVPAYKTEAYKTWLAKAHGLVNIGLYDINVRAVKELPIVGVRLQCTMHIRLRETSTRDDDNCVKPVRDFLTETGKVWQDDRQVKKSYSIVEDVEKESQEGLLVIVSPIVFRWEGEVLMF